MFTVGFNLIKPFLSEETAAKAVIVDSEYTENSIDLIIIIIVFYIELYRFFLNSLSHPWALKMATFIIYIYPPLNIHNLFSSGCFLKHT